MPDVYILHFDKPYWNNCTHYVGYAYYGVHDRISKHRNGNGSLLVKYALNHGCEFTLALVESFDRYQDARRRERAIKKAGHYSKICPVCQGTVQAVKAGNNGKKPLKLKGLSKARLQDILAGILDDCAEMSEYGCYRCACQEQCENYYLKQVAGRDSFDLDDYEKAFLVTVGFISMAKSRFPPVTIRGEAISPARRVPGRLLQTVEQSRI